MSLRAILVGALALLATGCLAPLPVPVMGSARIASDFDTYVVQRVGVMPFTSMEGLRLAAHEVGAVETAFHSEFSAATSYDLVPLRPGDLAETKPIDPFRDGWYTAETVRTIRDRHRLDALLVGTITSRKSMTPQVLGVQLDLVSCETGATIWSADILLDASLDQTREAILIWATNELGDEHAAKMALMSPTRFARFAAFQMARML